MKFEGFAFRQKEKAPIQVTFVAPSSALDSWAKVPTKMSNRAVGFQRAEIAPHVQEVRSFFQDPTLENCSPTAILLGVEPDDQGRVKILDASGAVLADSDIGATPLPCTIEIEFDPWSPAKFDGSIDAEVRALFAEVRAAYESPTTPEAATNTDVEDDETAEPSDAGQQNPESEEDLPDAEEIDEEDEEEEEDETASEVDAPDVVASNGLNNMTPAQVFHEVTSGAFTSWPLALKQRLRDQLKDDRKIGIIIDGQHRVKGTAGQGRIPFIVSLLPYASWAELAFQFIVNNSAAKKVDEGLLIAIVGHSLRPSEVSQMDGRLYRSGIKVSLIQAVMRVQNEENPFNGMLRFGFPGERGFLDAPAMQKKVVRKWYGSRGKSGQKPTFPLVNLALQKSNARDSWSLGEAFRGVCEGTNNDERARDWQDHQWFPFFGAFWQAVSNHFKGDLWPNNSDQWPIGREGKETPKVQDTRKTLMRVTVLGLLQSAILDVWWRDQKRLWAREDHGPNDVYTPKIDTFRKDIARLVKQIPVNFFTELKYTGFDASGSLREDFQIQLLKLLDGHLKFADIRTAHKFWSSS